MICVGRPGKDGKVWADFLWVRINNYMESDELLYTNISPDQTFLTVGSHSGFRVFQIHPFSLINESSQGNYKIVELYENTQLLILVGAGEEAGYSPRRLSIFNTLSHEVICETHFDDSVLSVRTNKNRISVATIDKIFIYNTTTMKIITVIPTPENPEGIQALSPNHTSSYLLYPSHTSSGQIQLFDTQNLQNLTSISAHKSKLSCISISCNSDLFTTSSSKGTIIRVFSLPLCQILFTFKRGLIPAQIYSIHFSSTTSFLVTTSSTGTIHIYDIRLPSTPSPPSWSSSFRSSLQSAATYILPKSYHESLESSRSFITCKLNLHKKFTACLVSNLPLLAVASSSGELFLFKVDLVQGGEATLSQHIRLNRK